MAESLDRREMNFSITFTALFRPFDHHEV